jgi:cation transport ATPase
LNISAADVVILSENLYQILALIRFLKRGNLFINLNLFWAFAYNIIIMPIVAGAFFHWDIFVSPVWSSIAMSGSSLFVVGFSHLLSFFHYDDSLRMNQAVAEMRYETGDLHSSSRDIRKYQNFQ